MSNLILQTIQKINSYLDNLKLLGSKNTTFTFQTPIDFLSESKKSLENDDNILFIPFNPSNPDTDIGKKYFYKDKEADYFITNGANDRMDSNGSGTTGAIANIDTKLFPNKNGELISTPYFPDEKCKTTRSKKELLPETYFIFMKEEEKKYLPVGSVVLVDLDELQDKKRIFGYGNLRGVYHILGIDWRGKTGCKFFNRNELLFPKHDKDNINKYLNDKVKDLNNTINDKAVFTLSIILFINKYYVDIITNCIKRSDGKKRLHLAPIPGEIFHGGLETYIGMVRAVEELKSTFESNKIVVSLGIEKEIYDKIVQNYIN